MMFLQRWLAAALAGLLVTMGAASAQVVTVADVKYATALPLQGSPLLLNGAGIRYKAVFKVYTAGLYLERKAGTPQEVAALRGPKRLSITMLRDIESAELGKLFSRGMEDNMDKASFSRLVPGVLRMSEIFSQHKKLSAGDTFTVDWLPGTGTVVSVKGVAQGAPFREPEFLRRTDGHLAGRAAGGLEAQGRPAGQVGWLTRVSAARQLAAHGRPAPASPAPQTNAINFIAKCLSTYCARA